MPEPILLQARYRSQLEKEIAEQLSEAGVPFEFEGSRLPYVVPQRTAHYLPDFRVGNIIIEGKGRFGTANFKRAGGRQFFTISEDGAKHRKKLLLVREAHPHLDIRLVFSRPGTPIRKGSKTTYAMWADENGFPWCKQGQLPAEWINDLKKEAKRCKTRCASK